MLSLGVASFPPKCSPVSDLPAVSGPEVQNGRSYLKGRHWEFFSIFFLTAMYTPKEASHSAQHTQNTPSFHTSLPESHSSQKNKDIENKDPCVFPLWEKQAHPKLNRFQLLHIESQPVR